ncbi:MAG: hypothetical protein HYV07_12770, partial [Deltaproteobacteria bacterium]|nr:hypothetical protein [Deltaproteobacteria bacterium]
MIVELFSRAPSVSVVRTCVRKQLSHQVMKRSPEPARLWVVCAGRPTGAIDQFSLRRRAFWPRGTYEGPPGMRLSLVVVTELPRTRATLLLRLLGRGAALIRALEDLEALPGDAPEVLLAEGAVDLIRRTVLTGRDRLGLDSAKAKELVMSRRLGEKILEQGRKQGIETGLR